MGNVKATYLSPQIAGFELGLQYAPNQGNGFSTCSTNQAVLTATTAAVGTASGCVDATSGNEPTRWYNQAGVEVCGIRASSVRWPWAPMASTSMPRSNTSPAAFRPVA